MIIRRLLSRLNQIHSRYPRQCFSTSLMAAKNDMKMDGWKEMWDKDDIGFHEFQVHGVLQKYFPQLCPDGQGQIFVPLCGKTLDMKWLSEKGLRVVGVDGVKKALEDFYSEHSLEWTEEAAPNMGPECHKLQNKSKEISLYFGDIFKFNKSVEGQFDCVWDRGSLVALNRGDVKKYAALLKSILRPGGKILVEVFEYDKDFFAGSPDHPPPFAMFEDEMRPLYEPECSVEMVDKDSRLMGDKEAKLIYYLIVKK